MPSPDAKRPPRGTDAADLPPASVKDAPNRTARRGTAVAVDGYSAGTLDQWLAARERVTGARCEACQ